MKNMKYFENILYVLCFCLGVLAMMFFESIIKKDVSDISLKTASRSELADVITIVGADTLHDEWFILDKGESMNKVVRGYSMPKYTLFLYYDWIAFKIVDNDLEVPMMREEMKEYIDKTNWAELKKME